MDDLLRELCDSVFYFVPFRFHKKYPGRLTSTWTCKVLCQMPLLGYIGEENEISRSHEGINIIDLPNQLFFRSSSIGQFNLTIVLDLDIKKVLTAPVVRTFSRTWLPSRDCRLENLTACGLWRTHFAFYRSAPPFRSFIFHRTCLKQKKTHVKLRKNT
jgi:hypothetical protein